MSSSGSTSGLEVKFDLTEVSDRTTDLYVVHSGEVRVVVPDVKLKTARLSS